MATESKRQTYTLEFRQKAVELALTAEQPTSQVARILKVKESTLANWVAAKKRALKNQGLLDLDDLKKKEFIDQDKHSRPKANNQVNKQDTAVPASATHHNSDQEPLVSQSSNHQPSTQIENESILKSTMTKLPQELQILRNENQRLKRERDIFREAVVLMARAE
ncbi:transposase [Endozoicomonas sp. OPT23]|uniref:transposase n=1 Tax=Endozoicomonas sp. OPT23 TaxID=2072845 RepID=UPI001891CA03|nr:transposase [Endozoicomonas sp. OPT23]